MRRKWRQVRKVKPLFLKGMRFERREEQADGRLPVGWRVIRDHFFHCLSGITLQRVMTIRENGEQWTHWECEELGGGNAGIGYWLAKARQKPRPQK